MVREGTEPLAPEIAGVHLLVGILYLVLGTLLWGGRSWAWAFGVILAPLSIIVDVAQMALIPVADAIPGNVFVIAVALIIPYGFTKPKVGAFLGRRPRPRRTSASAAPLSG